MKSYFLCNICHSRFQFGIFVINPREEFEIICLEKFGTENGAGSASTGG